MIVVFVGKSGKTTNAVNVACALAERPVSRRSSRTRRVLALDADTQGSLLEWSVQRTRPPLVEVRAHTEPTFVQDLPALLDGVDDLVIDAPAGTGRPGQEADLRIRVIRNAILAALGADNGIVVGVVVPSPFELWASDDLTAVIEEAWSHPGAAPGARTRTVTLLNRAEVSSRGGEGKPERVPLMVRAARNRLDGARIPMLDTVIHRRTDFVKAPVNGLAITEFAPRSAAANEVRALTTELLTRVGENK